MPVVPEPLNHDSCEFPFEANSAGYEAAVVDWLDQPPIVASWTAAGVMLVLAVVVVAPNIDELIHPTKVYWTVIGMIATCILFAAIFVVSAYRPVRATRARMEAAARSADGKRDTGIDSILAAELLAVALFRARVCADEKLGRQPRAMLIAKYLQEFGLELPRLVIDRRIAAQVFEITCPDHLLEPESLGSRVYRHGWYIPLISILALLFFFWWRGSDSFILGGTLIVATTLFLWRIAHAAFSGVRLGETGVVCGVGYIEGSNGARVGSWQVLTILSQSKGAPLRVRILASNWNLELLFASPRDPGFIAFWQRWNHPHPRPELLGEPAAT